MRVTSARIRRRWSGVALLAALALIIAACGAPDAEPEEPEAAPEEPAEEPEEPAEEPEEEDPLGDYPSGPVEVMVPFDAGSGATTVQRVFNEFAEKVTGVSMPIVNRPGAGGTVGWAELARTDPDGYFLAITTPPLPIIPLIVSPEETGYTLDDFAWICVYGRVPTVIYGAADGPYQTLTEAVEDAAANPGEVTVAVTGPAGDDALTMYRLAGEGDVELTPVIFEGGGESIQALLAGTVDLFIGSATFIEQQADTMIPLAIGTPERHESFPDVPTFVEQGYDVEAFRYRAFKGPAGLDPAIVDYWGNEVCAEVTSDPEFQAAMDEIGQPAYYVGPDDLEAEVRNMYDIYSEIVEEYIDLDAL